MGSPESVILTFQRGGGMRPPQDNEYFFAEDSGAFVMWRSIAWATNPPTPVGRFAGQLDAATFDSLKRELAAANKAGRLRERSSPDTAVDTIETLESRADVGVNDVPKDAWAPLLARLRGFLIELTRYPQAALALTISEDWQHVRLVHQGSQPLQLDLSAVTLHAALWKPTEQITLAEWNGAPANLGGSVTASPGWSLELPFQPDFKMVTGGAVRVQAMLTALDNGQAMPIALMI